jgi:catechol 2,3-dioxygenase-like lactoylglutathione lyase family enzyme
MRIRSRQRVIETNGEMAVLESEDTNHRLEINNYVGHDYTPGDQLDHIAFEVDNLDEALAELKAKEIEPVSYIRKSDNSRWTYVSDPDGIWIELFQVKP